MMSSVQRIVVVGGDSIAWLAAAALKQAFRQRELDVLVVDSGQHRDTPLGDWTLPSLRAIHGLLGIKESDFMRCTGATFKLASEHSGWQSDDQSFMHAHGEIGSDLNGTPFYKYLLRQAVVGRRQRAEDYSLAAVAARLRRFARPMTRTSLTSSFTYGFHLEEAAYCRYVRAHAEKLGVRVKDDACVDVSFAEDGNIATLTLQSGEQIQADYFLDCSGHQALLMDGLSPTDREDWAEWLPNDRMLSLSEPVIEDPPPVTRTIAGRAGWFWRIPLAQTSIAGHVYCSDYVNDDGALEQLKNVIGEGCGEPVLSSISSGRRRKFWNKNCVALGEAAVELEPLVGARLHLAQLGIANFIELFPIGTDSSLEAIEYNRIMGEHADALRDFTIAHYRAGPQKPGEYWVRTRAAPSPSRLADKLDLFRSNGRINLLDNESFEEVDWAWLLLGSGCMPERIELHTQANLERVGPEQCASLRASIAELAASMPRHIDYVRQQS
jgi:tryptophan halogenase